ncbi:MAG: hypothetical protein ACSLE1_03055 [Sphingobium sp.]
MSSQSPRPSNRVMEGFMDRVYYIILRAALKGEACPSNHYMSIELGAGLSTIEKVVKALDEGRWITIDRPARNIRIVTIEGRTTAKPTFDANQSHNMGVAGASEEQGSRRLLRAIAKYHVNQGRAHWAALAT